MRLPKCPICHENELRPVDYISAQGLRYAVVCDSCGLRIEHESFYGINQVERFFEDNGGVCSNMVDSQEDCNGWECSVCHSKREKGSGEPGYNFCPDCGAGVSSW